jgi:hypothetical protein
MYSIWTKSSGPWTKGQGMVRPGDSKNLEYQLVKEAHAAFSPFLPFPLAPRRIINLPQAQMMVLKWKSFHDETFKFKYSKHICTRHSCSKAMPYPGILGKKFSWSPMGEWGQHAWASFTVSMISGIKNILVDNQLCYRYDSCWTSNMCGYMAIAYTVQKLSSKNLC